MALSRDAIFAKRSLPVEEVLVPEWGGFVLVRALSALERDQYESSIMVGKGSDREVRLEGARVRLVVLATVDEAGNRLFSDGDAESIQLLSSAAVNRVYEKAARLAGILDSDLEELVAGFTPTQSEPSPSD